jgi:Bacterial regulatory proteins, lacI family
MDRAGIREVAKAAGVSISTVSRAFKRPELVSERTRRKVLETADKLDFNISRSATSLKSGQSYRVAMLMNEEITSWFNTEVFAGIDSVMHDAGYDISLFQHVDTAENRKEFFTNLPVRRNVDAVFVTSFGVDPKEIQQLKRIHVPIIGINTPTQSGFDATISIDDEDGMFTAAQHLINLGTRISCTCAPMRSIPLIPPSMREDRASSAPARRWGPPMTSSGASSLCRVARPSPTRR